MVWISLFMLLGLFTKDEVKRKRRFIKAFILLFVLSNSFLVNELALLTESKGTENLKPNYRVGLVLGGFSKLDTSIDRTVFYEANDRLMQALHLYHQGVISKIMISSGSGSIINQKNKEADAVYQYLKDIQIPDSNLIIENKSRNTLENIQFSYQILDSLNYRGDVLIITSAWHIPRTKLCAQDKDADFFACNYIADKKRDYSPMNLLVPSPKAMSNFELLLKEWIGYLMYLVKT